MCANVSAVFASDYGTTGLIDIPTARFDEDGVFAVGASIDERHRQFSVTYQATPWLQGTFRYTGFDEFFIGTATTSSRLGFGKKSYTCPR